MTEQFRQRFHIHAGLQRTGSKTMPQTMYVHNRQAILYQNFLEITLEITGFNRCSCY